MGIGIGEATDVTPSGFLVTVGGFETGVIITSFIGSVLHDFTEEGKGEALNVRVGVELAVVCAGSDASLNMSCSFCHCLLEAAFRSAGP